MLMSKRVGAFGLRRVFLLVFGKSRFRGLACVLRRFVLFVVVGLYFIVKIERGACWVADFAGWYFGAEL